MANYRLVADMLSGKNLAMLLGVLQEYTPDGIKLTGMEICRNDFTGERNIRVLFTRLGKDEFIDVKASREDGALMSWLPHEQILTKLRLLA